MIKNSIYCIDFREKMVGVNLYDYSIEGPFELWIKRIHPSYVSQADVILVETNGEFHRYQEIQHKLYERLILAIPFIELIKLF